MEDSKASEEPLGSVLVTEFPGLGMVVLSADENHPPPLEDRAKALADTVVKWLQDNPGHRVRATLPIVDNGRTESIFVWYDEAE